MFDEGVKCARAIRESVRWRSKGCKVPVGFFGHGRV